MKFYHKNGTFLRKEITYKRANVVSLTGAPEFQVDPSTGDIKVTAGTVFNKATKSEYSATVTATDSGNPISAGATTIKFLIVISE